MAEYIKKIRTDKGDFQIDYEALANKPKSDTTLKVSGAFADSKTVGDGLSGMSSMFSDYMGIMNTKMENVTKQMDDYIPQILTSEYYGVELPDAGNPGRIFFKKVNTEE